MPRTVKIGDREVTRIGLGTNRLTSADVPFVKAAAAAGLQVIDTAHLYTGGASERAIGEALSPFGPSNLVATKGGHGGAGHGRPQVLRDEIEESLRRLKTDVIDLYYLHQVDPETPIEASLGVIKEYQDRRKIRHIGISQVTVDQIERARKVVDIAAVQDHFNLGQRRHDPEVDYCTREGIAFVPFFPLRVEASRSVRDLATRRRITEQQVLLAWLLRRSPVMLPIPGTLSLDHLKQNLAALDVELTDAEFRSLAA